jgi:hypothetical protein
MKISKKVAGIIALYYKLKPNSILRLNIEVAKSYLYDLTVKKCYSAFFDKLFYAIVESCIGTASASYLIQYKFKLGICRTEFFIYKDRFIRKLMEELGVQL